jgi:hypothetical protein
MQAVDGPNSSQLKWHQDGVRTIPKETDLSAHTPTHLDRISRRLNGRPRQTLGFKTPSVHDQ